MWVRKSSVELYLERKARKVKYEIFIFMVLAFSFGWFYWIVGSIDKIIEMFIYEPEKAFYLLLMPLFVYLGYRNYVLHGNFLTYGTGKICLGCGIGLGYSDDGWRFKSYGMTKPKWYQFKACKTPEKCDIVYLCDVKYVQDENT